MKGTSLSFGEKAVLPRSKMYRIDKFEINSRLDLLKQHERSTLKAKLDYCIALNQNVDVKAYLQGFCLGVF